MRPTPLPLLTFRTVPRLRLAQRCLVLAVVLFAVALSGPEWGRSTDQGVLQGRDLVILVDLSKSMLAEDVSKQPRFQAVRQGLNLLFDTLQQRGGHRVGLVVFATEAWVVSPLTGDYDFLRDRIEEWDPARPPPETLAREEDSIKSGTQIGEAIRVGVRLHDPRFPGYQDLLLLTDGDDPDDLKNTDTGLTAARAATIPLHVVGIGTLIGAPLPIRSEIPLESKLQETLLKRLASEGRGEYVSWYDAVPRLGEFFRTVIEPRPSRDLGDLAVLGKQPRYRWFLLPAIVLLLVSWWLRTARG